MAWSCSYTQANQARCMLADVMLTSISMANTDIFYADTTHFWAPRRINNHIQYKQKQLTEMFVPNTSPPQIDNKILHQPATQRTFRTGMAEASTWTDGPCSLRGKNPLRPTNAMD